MFCLRSYPETELKKKKKRFLYWLNHSAVFSTSYLSWFALIAQLAKGMFLSAAVSLPTSVMAAAWAVAQLLINLQAVRSDMLPPRLKSSPPLFHRRHSETVQEEQAHFFSGCQCCRSSKHWLFTPAVFAAPAKRHIVQRSLLLFYRLSGHWGSSIQPLAHASQLEHSTCLGSSSCLCPNIIIPLPLKPLI